MHREFQGFSKKATKGGSNISSATLSVTTVIKIRHENETV